ncbi:hypothetical protein [Bosea sp. 2RAB26]|uniref:hypothetical protein n=1 Tax=Bosea sp. 2RAB26 TaxID=3237476 RepID=UPI003F91139E
MLNVDEARYNPMSYHNGSACPHDSALIALGFGKHGLKAEAAGLFEGIFDAAIYQEQRRLRNCSEASCEGAGGHRLPISGLFASGVGCRRTFRDAGRAPGPAIAGGDERGEANRSDPAIILRRRDNTRTIGASQFDLRVHRHKREVTMNVLKRSEGSKCPRRFG